MVTRERIDPEQVQRHSRLHSAGSRGGFSMVEVIIAIVILAFGLMGMAATTAVLVRQITLSGMTTDRTVAVQSTIESIRATPFDSVSGGSSTNGHFDITWTVSKPSMQWAEVEVITKGPGMARGEGGFPMLSNTVSDTFSFRILR